MTKCNCTKKLNELKLIELYFIAWLKDIKEKITKEELPTILNTLFTYYSRIPHYLDPTVAVHDCDKEKLSESLHLHNIIQDLGAYLVETYFYLITSQLDEAKAALDKVQSYMKHCVQLELVETFDYFVGFQYLIDLLQIHMHIIYDENDDDSMRLDWPTIPHSSNKQAMAAIWITKWTMNEVFSYRWDEAFADLKQIAELDSGNWIWQYNLCSRARAIRRNPGGHRSFPSQDEIQSSIKCLQLVPEYYYGMAFAASIQVLAEIVRFRCDNRQDEPLEYGEQYFLSNDAIVDHILTTIRSTIGNEKATFAMYIRYGETLSSILPYRYQDDRLSEYFLTKSLEKKPENSKAHHRMGIFQQTNKKDMIKAQQYFESAIKFDSRNTPAYLNLIHVLMRSKTDMENYLRLDSIFDDIFNRPATGFTSFSKSELWKFKFIHGFYFYKMNELEKAFELWIDCCNRESDDQLEKEFKSLSFDQKRCTKPEEVVHLDAIYETLKAEISTHVGSGCGNAHQFSQLENILEKTISSSRSFQAQSLRRGNEGRRRQLCFNTDEARETSGYGRRDSDSDHGFKSLADHDNSWRSSSSCASTTAPVAHGGVQTENPSHHRRGNPTWQCNNYSYDSGHDSRYRRNSNSENLQVNSQRGARKKSHRCPSPDSWR